MSADPQGSWLSVGPYRVTLAESIQVIAARKPGIAWRAYQFVDMLGFQAIVIVCLWQIFGASYRYVEGSLPRDVNIGLAVAAGLIGYFVVDAVWRWADRRLFNWQAGSRNDYLVQLDVGAVHVALGESRLMLPWTAIHRVVEHNSCILIFIDDLSAIVVPKRAFAQRAEADAFLTFARTRFESESRAPRTR